MPAKKAVVLLFGTSPAPGSESRRYLNLSAHEQPEFVGLSLARLLASISNNISSPTVRMRDNPIPNRPRVMDSPHQEREESVNTESFL